MWDCPVAIIETVIALALIFGFARKVTYIFSALVALGIWSIAEGFGGPHSSTSTDIGSAVIYAVVAMSLLAMSFQCGLSRYSVDHYLERRLPWWHKVAEIGAHNHPAPASISACRRRTPRRSLPAADLGALDVSPTQWGSTRSSHDSHILGAGISQQPAIVWS